MHLATTTWWGQIAGRTGWRRHTSGPEDRAPPTAIGAAATAGMAGTTGPRAGAGTATTAAGAGTATIGKGAAPGALTRRRRDTEGDTGGGHAGWGVRGAEMGGRQCGTEELQSLSCDQHLQRWPRRARLVAVQYSAAAIE